MRGQGVLKPVDPSVYSLQLLKLSKYSDILYTAQKNQIYLDVIKTDNSL